MPKELIHFKVAERMAGLLAESRYADCLDAEPAGLLLGAVAHDALFYAVRPKTSPLEGLAHRFHGVFGHDTADLLRLQLEQVARSSAPDLPVALLAGMISHLFVDAAMHPLVWHFSGNYYHADPKEQSLSRQRHRIMENIMDRVTCPEMFGDPRYYLRTLLRRCPDLLNGLPVDEMAAMAGLGSNETRTQLREAWALFAAMQRACAMLPLGWGLRTVRPMLPDAAREVAALFHAPQHMHQAEFMEDGIGYVHPVTGKPRYDSLDGLAWSAARSAARCCLDLEEAVFNQGEPTPIAALPSLETGLPGVPADRMRHFASPPFPELS